MSELIEIFVGTAHIASLVTGFAKQLTGTLLTIARGRAGSLRTWTNPLVSGGAPDSTSTRTPRSICDALKF